MTNDERKAAIRIIAGSLRYWGAAETAEIDRLDWAADDDLLVDMKPEELRAFVTDVFDSLARSVESDSFLTDKEAGE